MRLLRSILDSQAKHFERGGRLEFAFPVYEMIDTFLYTPGAVTKGASHVRDGLDLKRMMVTVVVALIPAVFMAMYNTGYQAHLAIAKGAPPLIAWQTDSAVALGLGAWDPNDTWACIVHGALYYLPVLIMTFSVGVGCEALFALVRKHEINEGFLVTGMLFPLILPPTIPLWQVALGIAFGVIVGKEIFGGTGMNILNPALTARAFLFFAYPAPNMPALVPNTSTFALTNATLPFLKRLADQGVEAAIAENTALRCGVNTYRGVLTNPPVAESQGRDWQEIPVA